MKRKIDPAEHFHVVILAGGRGTRFWPRSRRRLPKQLLPVVGEQPLLRQTFERLSPLAPPERVWALTSEDLAAAVRETLPEIPEQQIVPEPEGRNTAPAIGLAARLTLEKDPDAVLGVFPSDHLITNEKRFLSLLQAAMRAASRDKLVVLGIKPTRVETGFGYIEFPAGVAASSSRPRPVLKFHEKPKRPTAKRYFQRGHYYWNAGIFVWRAAAIWNEIERLMPDTATALEQIDPSSPDHLSATLKANYSDCDNISIDHGVLEHAEGIVGFACPDFGWSDVGSWEAVYELMPKDPDGNVRRAAVVLEKAGGNFIDAPGKLVALLHVHDLVIVDSPDALLICPRKEAQKVSSLVKALELEGVESVL